MFSANFSTSTITAVVIPCHANPDRLVLRFPLVETREPM